MSGDYSRLTFDPRKGFEGTFLQQGRVALDSDWNESVSAAIRRVRVAGLDIMGRSAVPRETADGFKITAAVTAGVKSLSIGRGRIYVDGILVENGGPLPLPDQNPPARFDLVTPRADGIGSAGVLGELMGGDQLSYASQPFVPVAPTMPDGNGPHLVYLDVWQREVTAVEDDSLLEPALGGVDTTTRLQTVWQVRVLENIGAGVNCTTPDADIPGWLDVTRASGARLTTELVPVPPDDDPCLVPPESGYKGIENQLYRVEMHTGGNTAAARFKWSRENASVATNVTGMESTRDVIVVERLGRDDFLRIREGDWIEVTDDRRELGRRSGDLRKVVAVVSATRRITLTAPLTADLLPAGTVDDNFGTRHTRVRKWDQRGAVLDGAGNVLVDLDAPGADGTIPVPPGGGAVRLESGIQIRFTLDPGSGVFQVADSWNFAARVAGGTIDELDRAPPRAIHHHFARLAMVTFPSTATDCRHLWPPELGGDNCACNVCVTPESHASGVMTLQRAVDLVKDKGGTVCLEEGDYQLGDKPLLIEGARGVRVVGKGLATLVTYTGAGPMFRIDKSTDVAIRDLELLFTPGIVIDPNNVAPPGGGILFRNSVFVTVERCWILVLDDDPAQGAAIQLDGIVTIARIRENVLFAGIGVLSAPMENDDYALLDDVFIERNRIGCGRQGVNIGGMSFFAGEIRVCDNFVTRGDEGAIAVELGETDPDHRRTGRVIVSGNRILSGGPAIRVGAAFARIAENHIRAEAETPVDAIAIVGDPDGGVLQSASVVDNVIVRATGHGVVFITGAEQLEIARNTFTDVDGAAIFFDMDASAQSVRIEGNSLLRVAASKAPREGEPFSAIVVQNSGIVRVLNNTLRDVARNAREISCVGIEVFRCESVEVCDNDLLDIGGPRFDFFGFGIAVVLLGATAVISRNTVSRSSEPIPEDDKSLWYGIIVVDDFQIMKNTWAKASRALYVRAAGKLVGVTAAGFKVLRYDGPGTVCVANNSVFGSSGAGDCVDVLTAGSCQFVGNYCESRPDTKAQYLVELTAGVGVVSNNVLRRPDELCLHLQIANGDPPPYTVLGNVCGRPNAIQVNGAALIPPWKQLNA